jgi:hypothetical protein
MTLPEAAFQRRITDLCDWLHLRYWHDTDSRRNVPGWPDLVIVGNGVVFVELKTERGRVRPEQQAWHDDLKRAGAEVYIWRPSHWDFITDRLHALAGRHLHVVPGGSHEMPTPDPR